MHHPKSKTLSTTIFSKPTDARIYLNPKIFSPRVSKTSQSHNSYVSATFAPTHLITSRKVIKTALKTSLWWFQTESTRKRHVSQNRDEILHQTPKKPKRKDNNSHNLAYSTETFISISLRKISSTYWKRNLPSKSIPEKPITEFHKKIHQKLHC